MKSVKAVAYARVSTLLGQDVENQLVRIRELAINRDLILVEEYIDEGLSGRTDKRPGLKKLIRDAKHGHYKILIISSIDRLFRSSKDMLILLDELKHYGVSIISIREALDFSTATGQMALTMISAVAQLEAQLTSERIKTTLAVKKKLAEGNPESNWRMGRPPINDSVKEKVLELRDEGHSIRKIAQILGTISKSSVEKIIKEFKRNECP
jgi:DNA invertase Pin-like site-specific DNA recombinase